MPYVVKDVIALGGQTLQRGTVIDDATGDRLSAAGHHHSLRRVEAGHAAMPVSPAPSPSRNASAPAPAAPANSEVK